MKKFRIVKIKKKVPLLGLFWNVEVEEFIVQEAFRSTWLGYLDGFKTFERAQSALFRSQEPKELNFKVIKEYEF